MTVLLTSSPVLLSLVLPRGAAAEGSMVRIARCSTLSDSGGNLRIVKSEQGQCGRFQNVVIANSEQ